MLKKYLIILHLIGTLSLYSSVFSQTFTVDFSKWIDEPILKTKFCVYQTPIHSDSGVVKDNSLLPDINVAGYRYEFGWGKGKGSEMSPPLINKVNDTIRYKIDSTGNMVDSLFDGINSKSVKPLFINCYSPVFLQNGNYRSAPTDFNSWQAISKHFAEHWRNKGFKAPMYEMWNESDNSEFYSGSISDYFKIYQYGALGTRAGDPDALVGGTAAAGNSDWMDQTLNYIKNNNLPLDFLSGHAYSGWQWQLDHLRSMVAKYNLTNIPLLLTEWGSYSIAPGNTESVKFGLVEKTPLAVRFFVDAKNFLSVPDLTQIYMAQWRDCESLSYKKVWYATGAIGMVSQGKRKPIYNAMKLYAQMPDDRAQVISTNISGLDAMASFDEHSAAIIIWNTTSQSKNFSVNLKHLPFSNGKLKIYRIDKQHGSYLDCGMACESNLLTDSTTISMDSLSWSGSVPDSSIVLLKCIDNSGISLISAQNIENSKYVKTLYWFPERTKNYYAFYDPKTWIARLGMNNNTYGTAVTGAVIDDPASSIAVNVKKDSVFQTIDQNSLFGIRIDYQATDGSYSKSVVWHGGIYSPYPDSTFPWGKGKTVDVNIKKNEFNTAQDFIMDINGNAPTNWNKKRIIISFIMRNTGANSRARIMLKSAVSNTQSQLPFNGVLTIPGTIEAENFDNGGENISFYVQDTTNKSTKYRKNYPVSIDTCSLGGYSVKLKQGEWMQYTVNVKNKASYIMTTNFSSSTKNNKFHVEFNNTNVTGLITLDSTGISNWKDSSQMTNLEVGQQIMRIVCDSGQVNLNHLVFAYAPLPIGTGQGLTGNYFNQYSMIHDSLSMLRIDTTINFKWTTSPDTAIKTNRFAVLWTGKIQTKYSEQYTFYLTTDNPIRLWIGDSLLIDKWQNDLLHEYSNTMQLSEFTKYKIKIEFLKKSDSSAIQLAWSSASQLKEIVPKIQLYYDPAIGNGIGVTGDFFNGMNFDTLKITHIDRQINSNFGNYSPHVWIGNNQFSIRWTGFIQPEYSDVYTFIANTDNGRRLWINDSLIINKWDDTYNVDYFGTIYLEAGKKYPFKMEYYENTGGANARLDWQCSHQLRETIPQSQFYPIRGKLRLPYFVTPQVIPGSIEAVNYDFGGEGNAYYDDTPGNNGGTYRVFDDVDIFNCSEGGFKVGSLDNNEWLEYTVDVKKAGYLYLHTRYSSKGTSGKFHLEFNGVKLITQTCQNTSDYQKYTDVTNKMILLDTGVQVMRFFCESAGFDLKRFVFDNNPLGIKDISVNENGFVIFPNPVTDNKFHIELLEPNVDKNTLITLFDLQGRIVFEKQFTSAKDIEISNANLPAGIYLLSVKNDKNIFVKKLIVQ